MDRQSARKFVRQGGNRHCALGPVGASAGETGFAINRRSQPAEWIPTRVSIGAYPPDETVRLAVEFWEAGVRTLKFKTGVPGIDDVARLRAVRERLGDEPDLHDRRATAPTLQPTRPCRRSRHWNLLIWRWSNNRRAAIGCRCWPKSAAACRCRSWRTKRYSRLTNWRKRLIWMRSTSFRYTRERMAVLRIRWRWPSGLKAAGKLLRDRLEPRDRPGASAHVVLAASLSAFPVDRYACDLMGSLFYASSAVTPPVVFDRGRVALPTGPGFGVTPRV